MPHHRRLVFYTKPTSNTVLQVKPSDQCASPQSHMAEHRKEEQRTLPLTRPLEHPGAPEVAGSSSGAGSPPSPMAQPWLPPSSPEPTRVLLRGYVHLTPHPPPPKKPPTSPGRYQPDLCVRGRKRGHYLPEAVAGHFYSNGIIISDRHLSEG